MLVIHALKQHCLFQRVNRDIDDLVPLRIQIWEDSVRVSQSIWRVLTIVDDLSSSESNIVDEYADIRITFTAKCSLDVLHVSCLLHPESEILLDQ